MEEVLIIFLVFAAFAVKLYMSSLGSGDKLLTTKKSRLDGSADSSEIILKDTCVRLKGSMDRDGRGCSGKIDGISYWLKTDFAYGFLLLVYQSLPVSGSVSIKGETVVSRLQKKLGENDFQAGDRLFDDTMLVETTEPVWLTAVLNNETRELVVELFKETEKLEVTEKNIHIGMTWDGASVEKIIDVVDKTVTLSKALSVKEDIKKRLIRNLLYDLEGPVRLNNLKALGENFADSPGMAKIYNDALEDPFVEVQVEAAILLKNKGMEDLVRILNSPEKISDALLLRIIEHLHENCYSIGTDILKQLYNQKTDHKIRLAVLRAFETFGDTELAPFLERKLNGQDTALFVPLLKAMGTCGTVDEIETIDKIAKSAGQSKVRDEARKAMALIQEKYGVDKGWLSVSEHAESDGALSMANEEAEGGLSMTGEEQSKN